MWRCLFRSIKINSRVEALCEDLVFPKEFSEFFSESEVEQDSNKIIIYNVPKKATTSMLRELMPQAESIRILNERCEVEFQDLLDARNALKHVNGYEINGTALKAELDESNASDRRNHWDEQSQLGPKDEVKDFKEYAGWEEDKGKGEEEEEEGEFEREVADAEEGQFKRETAEKIEEKQINERADGEIEEGEIEEGEETGNFEREEGEEVEEKELDIDQQQGLEEKREAEEEMREELEEGFNKEAEKDLSDKTEGEGEERVREEKLADADKKERSWKNKNAFKNPRHSQVFHIRDDFRI
ncbi:unnamed protein product [Blepharisma stoltei]|uniref:RRM domain-containing protein n=1 Tax=Blepharisma stoltei TaxID=1481888 RepID=A0AAU9KC13_9CILI|nr:unnamed protein product [Blepharisma stoltei]